MVFTDTEHYRAHDFKSLLCHIMVIDGGLDVIQTEMSARRVLVETKMLMGKQCDEYP